MTPNPADSSASPSSGGGVSADDLDTRIEEMNSYIHHSRYAEAAALARQLWDSGAKDVRILGAYLYGPVLEQGVAALPDLLRSIETNLGSQLADLGPPRKKPELADSTLSWLLGAVHKQLVFAHQEQGGRRQTPISPSARAPLREALLQCATTGAAISAAIKRPRSLTGLQRLEELLRVMHESLGPEPAPAPVGPAAAPVGPAAAPVNSTAAQANSTAAPVGSTPASVTPVPAAAPQPVVASPAVAVAGVAPAAEADLTPRVALRPPGGEVIQIDGTPALVVLLRKLGVFAALIQRKDYLRASIVVRDLQDTVEHFDPRDYFPQLFATYSSLLANHMEALEPFLDGEGTRSIKALQQLYQVDLDLFLKDPR